MMPYLDQVSAIGQRADKKVTVTLQRTAPRYGCLAHQEQDHNGQAPNSTNSSGFQCALSCRHVLGCTANAETLYSGAEDRLYHPHEHLEHVKVLDASRSTFNKIGRDQYNQHSCYNTFVVHHHHNHFYSRGSLDDRGLGINTLVVTNGRKPTRIISTTTFRTTNVSVVAPYFANFGIEDFSSEASEDLTLTVERTSVRYTFFSDST